MEILLTAIVAFAICVFTYRKGIYDGRQSETVIISKTITYLAQAGYLDYDRDSNGGMQIYKLERDSDGSQIREEEES